MLGFLELPDEEVPPEEIWGNPGRLEEWFEVVKQNRRDGTSRIDAEETVPMMKNELTAELLGEK